MFSCRAKGQSRQSRAAASRRSGGPPAWLTGCESRRVAPRRRTTHRRADRRTDVLTHTLVHSHTRTHMQRREEDGMDGLLCLMPARRGSPLHSATRAGRRAPADEHVDGLTRALPATPRVPTWPQPPHCVPHSLFATSVSLLLLLAGRTSAETAAVAEAALATVAGGARQGQRQKTPTPRRRRALTKDH